MPNDTKKIKEELGRNYFSTNTDPIQGHEIIADDAEVRLYPEMDGYAVEIIVHSDASLSSPRRLFPNETEAQHFARQYIDFLNKVLQSKK